MSHIFSEAAIFSGSSHPVLAQQIASEAGLPLGKISISQFADGEINVAVEQTVRDQVVFVVQSLALRPNHYLMELLIIIDALRRAAVRSVIPIITYFGYARQDRKDKLRVPITAKLVANLLERAGAARVLTMDLHAAQIEGFFDIPVDNIMGKTALLTELTALERDVLVVVAPDIGSIKFARSYASALGTDFAVIDKQRTGADEVEVLNLIGNIAGKNVLLADDMCTTGSTLVSAAKACHEKGAQHIYAAVTHGVLVGKAVAKLEASPLEKLFITDTVPWSPRLAAATKIRVAAAAPLFGHAVRCTLAQTSLSSLL